ARGEARIDLQGVKIDATRHDDGALDASAALVLGGLDLPLKLDAHAAPGMQSFSGTLAIPRTTLGGELPRAWLPEGMADADLSGSIALQADFQVALPGDDGAAPDWRATGTLDALDINAALPGRKVAAQGLSAPGLRFDVSPTAKHLE